MSSLHLEANKKLENIFLKLSSKYPSVSLVFGGAAESTKESMDSLFDALTLSLIGIFALLVFLFKSFLRPVIIMTTIPLGLLGFSIAFWLHQRPISFLALIGIIGLGGIIVNSGIVLISFIDQMREEGEMDFDTILVKASGLRLRAVLVTSLTTISCLIPTAYGIGGTDAILVPMTLAMAWGLTSGTILTLIWVPCAYAILEDWNRLMKRLFAKTIFNQSEESTTQP
jgi:multidrug efflux pump subunit AcrB